MVQCSIVMWLIFTIQFPHLLLLISMLLSHVLFFYLSSLWKKYSSLANRCSPLNSCNIDIIVIFIIIILIFIISLIIITYITIGSISSSISTSISFVKLITVIMFTIVAMIFLSLMRFLFNKTYKHNIGYQIYSIR